MIRKTNGVLEEYYRKAECGEIVMGEELKTVLRGLLNDMNSEEYVFDTKEADKRIFFINNCLRTTKSPFYNKPFKTLEWQDAFITALYSFYMQSDMSQRFRKALLLISRKNGKSELCSALLLTDFFIGGSGMDIVCASNNDTQADILFQACDTMRLLVDPKSYDTWRNQKGLRCFYNDNRIFKMSERSRTREGRNIDTACFDEGHELREGDIIKAIEQSQSIKENPKLICITTEGFTNDGWLDKELIQDRKIIAGEIKDASSVRVLPWLYSQDSEREVWDGDRDNRLWMKSNPSLGVIKRYDYLEGQIDLAKRSKEDRAFVLAKDFNIKQSNAEAWLKYEDYMYEADFDPQEFEGALVLGAVDIAETTDLCCAKVLLMNTESDKKYILTMYWIPQGKLDKGDLDIGAGAKYEEWQQKGILRVAEGNYVDTTIIADWFYELYKKYGFRLYKCGYDVKFSKDFIHRMEDYGMDCEIVYQSPQVMSQPMKMVEADLKDRLIIGNNDMDRWCFSNTSLQLNSQGLGLAVKIDKQNSRKIDGAVTTIILYEMFRRYRLDFTNALER